MHHLVIRALDRLKAGLNGPELGYVMVFQSDVELVKRHVLGQDLPPQPTPKELLRMPPERQVAVLRRSVKRLVEQAEPPIVESPIAELPEVTPGE